jgi:hypothetical protein
MKEEKERNDDLKQLLDALEEHGRNAKRQQQLSDLIDQLAAQEKTVEVPRNRRKLVPLWWAMGAAAACLLLWLLAKPTTKQIPEMEEKNLVEVEKVEATDSIKIEEKDVVIVKPVVKEELLAEEMPAIPQKTPTMVRKPKMKVVEEKPEEPILAEVILTEPAKSTDTENIGSNTIPAVNETPADNQKPQRRVIRSLNLVCYECQKDPEYEFATKPNMDNKTLFGQPQDPNMKNGSLAFELKLH